MVVFYDTERIAVALNLLLEVGCILLCHPPAQDIKIVQVMLGDGCHLPHIKVSGKCPDHMIGRHQVVLAVADGFHNGLVRFINLFLERTDPVIQHMAGLHRGPFIFIRKETPLKMHGCIDGIDLVCQLFRHKVDHPHIVPVLFAFEHDRINGIVHIGGKLFIVLFGNAPEPELDKPESKYLLHTVVQPCKGNHLVLGRLQLVPLVYQNAFFVRKFL